jgi:hypothetical protein
MASEKSDPREQNRRSEKFHPAFTVQKTSRKGDKRMRAGNLNHLSTPPEAEDFSKSGEKNYLYKK